ncbi:hypothetical protein [Ulvibacterium marinum]|uniref:Uncharacterized protein n=1 Tax=Ulvibacterium marinum TaxID=2419782 RepID=A0A3B0C5R1_9FLAO|nr:hypothetical protein [Ulvibacterium marinum]RKN80912.1 hypothetical protein D7Z94_08120 [Ulvibacterium marinum]
MKFLSAILFVFTLFLTNGESEFRESFSTETYNDILDKAPEYYLLEWKAGTKLSKRKAGLFIKIDSFDDQEVAVMVNGNQDPVLYASDVSTPVCADGECKLMHIRLYWTLLGEYAGFDTYPKLPLTKHDHDEFRKEDYEKLHKLLADDKSILKRRRIDELVEEPVMRNVNGVDALSGATVAEVKESVVSGALYSCYVAWHLTHGTIRDEIKTHTLSTLNANMLTDMLYSQNTDYQLFALEKMDSSQFIEHHSQTVRIFKTAVPLVRSIIAKEMPEKFRNRPELQRPFWEAFPEIDIGSRSLLLRHLESAPPYVGDIVSAQLGSMTKNQIAVFLEFLSPKKHTPELLKNLHSFADSENEAYSYLVKNYLEEHVP